MTLINFDDRASNTINPISSGYQGFNWSNFYAYNGVTGVDSYPNGVVSPNNIAYNGFGTSASFSSAAPFTLNSFFLTSAIQPTQSYTVTGSLNGAQIYSSTITVNNQAPTLETFNWSGINSVTITPSIQANGRQFALDNLRVNEPIPAPCYVTGTHIRTLRGRTVTDVPVERLRVGDLAITASGKPCPIRWIGTRRYLGLSAPRHDRPVRIRACALADGMPARDLLVSPDHCLWLDGLLVAAGHLVNGTSITRGEAVADLTYWHVELDSHDMLLAENTPAESFLAAPGVRGQFDGAQVRDAATAPASYAPRIEPGPELTALRARLIRRAGLSVGVAPRLGSMRAWMDKCDGRRVAGWAQDTARPQVPVCLDIVVDGEIVAMTLAEEYRADIAAVGVGEGCHGFDVDLDEPLAPGTAHTVEVRRSTDGLRVCAMAVDAAGVWTPLLAA